MESTTSEPSLQKLNRTVFDISVKKEEWFNLVIDIAEEFIQEYTDYQFPKLDESAPVSLKLECQFCGKVFTKGPLSLRNHKKEALIIHYNMMC